MCSLLGITKPGTTPMHPQSDGMVERFNRTLIDSLAKMTNEQERDWDTYIPIFLLAYRCAIIHESTNHSPAEVVFGRNLRLPFHLEFGQLPYQEDVELENFGIALK